MTSDVTVTPDHQRIIDGFFTGRRAKHGDLRMEATSDAGAAPAGDAGGDAAGAALPAEGAAPAATPAAPAAGGPVDIASLGLSAEQQAAINALIGKRVGETKTSLERAHKAELASLQELAGKTEAEKAALQLEQASTRTQELTQRLVAAEAKAVLAQAGVLPEHHAAVLKLAELPTSESGEVDVEKVAEAITATLDTYSMFKPQPKATTEPPAPIVNPGAGVSETNPPEQGKPKSLVDAVNAYWNGSTLKK